MALELLSRQVAENRKDIGALRQHLDHEYLDKNEINKEFLSMEAQRKMVSEAKQTVVNMWIVGGVAIGGLCTVGTFILLLIEKIGGH